MIAQQVSSFVILYLIYIKIEVVVTIIMLICT